MRNNVQPLIGFIRAALYSGQRSEAKSRAQDAFEQLCAILADQHVATETGPSCGKHGFCLLPAGHDGDCLDAIQVELKGAPSVDMREYRDQDDDDARDIVACRERELSESEDE